MNLNGKHKNTNYYCKRKRTKNGTNSLKRVVVHHVHFLEQRKKTMDRETIFFEMIIDFLDIPSVCRLASANKSLNSMLKETSQNHKHKAYELLSHLDTATDFFSVKRSWQQFNALYIVRKETGIRRRMNGARLKLREFQFGFYTGRKDEWHHCLLSLPPLWTNLGARLRVVSYDRYDEKIATRTFDSIFSVEKLIRILETRYWHSKYCIFTSRWSIVEGEASPVLVLGLEE